MALSEDLFQRLVGDGDDSRAADRALRLSLQWFARGDVQIAFAWMARARRLLDSLPRSPLHGYLAYLEASVDLEITEDPEPAAAAATAVRTCARDFADPALDGDGLGTVWGVQTAERMVRGAASPTSSCTTSRRTRSTCTSWLAPEPGSRGGREERHTGAARGGGRFRLMSPSRPAKDFFRPLAVGAPDPVREVPARPSRAIHFFDPSNEKMASKIPDLVGKVDVLLGNLEDAVKADNKEAARAGLVTIAQATAGLGGGSGPTQLWSRVNALDSPWVLDDLTTLVGEIGHKLDVIMVPKVQGAEDIHYVDRLLAQLEARAGLDRPILVHAILETARGVANVEEICGASPRMQGLSLGPADLAADRRMKTTRVGGGHPGYLVRQDPDPQQPDLQRRVYQQDLWHYTIARMVDACAMHGIYPYYGPFGDIADEVACEDQFRNAFLLGCVGTWTLHPKQIAIANRVFSPSVEDIAHARRVVAAMGDGTGAVMLDGKMEDDASLKQCLVMVELADQLAAIDPELAKQYEAIAGE